MAAELAADEVAHWAADRAMAAAVTGAAATAAMGAADEESYREGTAANVAVQVATVAVEWARAEGGRSSCIRSSESAAMMGMR